MSEHDSPSAPQLTRRQLRELRNTASNPIVGDDTGAVETAGTGSADASHEGPTNDTAADHAETRTRDEPSNTSEDAAEEVPSDADAAPDPTPVVAAPVAPLAREAEPAAVAAAPAPDATIDLGAPALTRRQARLQERIRTASVPVITPDALHSPDAPASAPVDAEPVDADAVEAAPVAADPVEAEPIDGAEAPADELVPPLETAETVSDAEPDADLTDADEAPETAPEVADIDDAPDTGDTVSEDRHVVSEELGAGILSGELGEVELPTSFDQLLSRSAAATGAFTAPNALILAQAPDATALVAPITGTGEILVTGTFALPDRFGSTGIVPGSTDGRDVDAVLVDGELPPASSPTPIAASSAISTIKSAEDVIRPPAPEKGSRLMMVLAITAGVLAVALAGVLILAFTTGAIQ